MAARVREVAPNEVGHPMGRAAALDLSIIVALIVLAVAVRRPGYMLRHPFWLDEAWVADSTLAPLHRVPFMTSTTPVGWSLLLRLVPPLGGLERFRLLPLAFATGTVVPAYFLGWEIFSRRLWAMLFALSAAATPAALRHHELKQYTADAFMAVVILWLAARAERLQSPRSQWTMAGAGVAGMLVSHTTAFVASSAFVALLLVAVGRRAWRAAASVAAAGAAFVTGALVVYVVADRRGVNPRLTGFRHWVRFYLPTHHGVREAGRFILRHGKALLKGLEAGPWWLALVLVLLGVATLALRHRPAVALLLPVLVVELLAASALRRYPFGDERTSLFLSVVLTLVLLVPFIQAAEAARRFPPGSGILIAGACALIAFGAWHTYGTAIPTEDVRGQVRYLAAHRRPGEPIVVNQHGAYTFAYYWRENRPLFVRSDNTDVTFRVRYAPDARVIVATRSVPADVQAALRSAASIVHGGRVWILLSHVTAAERTDWLAAAWDLGSVEATGEPGLFLLALQQTGP